MSMQKSGMLLRGLGSARGVATCGATTMKREFWEGRRGSAGVRRQGWLGTFGSAPGEFLFKLLKFMGR